MSERDDERPVKECGADVAAYALGALEPAEAAAFLEHLRSCSVCREELAEFQNIVDVIPGSVPTYRAPAGLRARVLDQVYAEAGTVQEQSSPRRRRWTWALGSRPTLALGTSLAVVVAAVVAVLALGGPGPAGHVYSARVFGPGSAHVTVTGGRAELSVHHLNEPPAGEIYEVWLARPNHRPAPTTALFSVTTHGDADVDVPGNLRGVRQIMVTPEPAGGSRVPTNPPVIRAQLT
jgi:anti-sigma-K factor RskA